MKAFRSILLIIGLLLLAAYRLRRYVLARLLRLPAPAYPTAMESGLRIPMQDGLSLAADHYWPVAFETPFPTILIRSPYGRGKHAGIFGMLLDFCARRFAERGYHVVIQDTRGRFDSDGDFDPYFNEKADGLATLDWLSRQPWFDGTVGLWGGSYLGIVQWVIADSPLVRAMVPSITSSQLQKVVYPDGALDLSLAMRWMAIFQMLDNSKNLFDGLRRFIQMERAITPAFAHLPLYEADAVALGGRVAFYRTWLKHATPGDPLWADVHDNTNPARVTAAAHFVGGWYDFFLRTMLDDYKALRDAGRKPYLTIGPWHHFTQIASMVDLSEGLAWFDAHLKQDVRRLREHPVRIYVMGANEWRDMEAWPPPSTPTPFYLHSGRLLNREAATDESPDHYWYDPASPTPAVGGTQFGMTAGARDNRALEARPDVLTFTTPALAEALEIIGEVRLHLYVQSSLEHTDFFGRLCDVHPDGRSVNICDGLFRVEPGKGTTQPDGSLCIEVDMWATAHRFQPGHAVRLQVSSGAHPRWNRNMGTGEMIGMLEMKRAAQTILHDGQHPSALILPVSPPLWPHGAGTV